MKKEWIKYLCDPIDKTNLKILKIIESKDGYITTGELISDSKHLYKIRNGVPILLNKKTQNIKTVDSFNYEWNTFDFSYGKKGWLKDVIKPTVKNERYFKNKIVVDCGAGSGRQSLWIAEAGASFVFSIELSDSATTIVKKVTSKIQDRIFVIQADLAHIPLKEKTCNVDIAYCVNVIQHTTNPTKSIEQISNLLKNNTEIIFNIYLLRDMKIKIKVVQFFKKVLSIFPIRLIKLISYLISLMLYPFWLNKHSFKEFWLDIYDLLGTHSYQKFYSEDYLVTMLSKAKLKIINRSYYAILLRKIN